MTPEEALEICRLAKSCFGNLHSEFPQEELVNQLTEQFEIAVMINALEHKIPKKPKIITQDFMIKAGWKYKCPSCNCAVGKNKYVEYLPNGYIEPYENFCPHCGQHLNWEDEENDD